MSLTTSTFGTPVAPSPPSGPGGRPTAAPESAQASRRNVVVLAVVAAALALVAAVYLLLFTGGSEPDLAAAAPVPTAPAATAPAPAPSAVATPVVRQKAVKARNPFAALVVPQAPTRAQPGAGVAPVTPVPVPVASVPVSRVPVTRVPVTRVPVPQTPVTPVPGAGAGAAPRPAAVTVRLGAVSDDNTMAALTVGGKAVRVRPGADFGTDYRLLNLRDGSCGAVQLGSVVVDLCEGKSYTTR